MAKNIYSTSTSQPEAKIEYARRKRLTDEQWDSLALDVKSGCDAAKAARSVLDENLGEWSDMYEMLAEPKDHPWPNASNLKTPLIASELEALVAYIAGQVLVPRLFLVSGLTDAAVGGAPLMERALNADLKRQRGDSTWFEEFVEWLHMSTRDGTGYLEALWKYKKTQLRIFLVQPLMEDDPDAPGQMRQVLDADGLPAVEKIPQTVDDIYNDVELKARELGEVLMLPADARSVDSAIAVIVRDFLYEDRLMEMVHDGVLDKEEVELALSTLPSGSTDKASTDLPTNTDTAGDTLNIGIGQGTQASSFFKNRGPVEVYRVHTRQYDLDNDGTPEENIIWSVRSSGRMLGWTRYEYVDGSRPLFPFSPFSRPGRQIGFSLVGRLAGLSNERDAIRNQRLDLNDLLLGSPGIGRKGSSLEDQDFAWNPRATWWTENPQQDYMPLPQRNIPPSAFQEEAYIVQDAKEYTGLSNPLMGQPSGGKRSATEARMWQSAAMTRTGLLAMRYRLAIRPVVNFITALRRQYLTDDQSYVDSQGKFTVPHQVATQDYQIDVAGASDPVDATTRRAETANGYELLMQNPIVQSDPRHVYALTRKLVESLDWGPESDKIIGTEQELLEKLSKAQAAQPPGAPGQAPGGQPGANGGQPHPGGPPAPHPAPAPAPPAAEGAA